MTRRRDLIACSAQRIAGPAAAQSYEWSAEDLVFLPRRVRPTPSGRLTRDVPVQYVHSAGARGLRWILFRW